MDSFADEIIDIAEDGGNDWMTRKRGEEEIEVVNREAIERSRLRIDARKWLMSKCAPKKYGEKIVNEHSGPDGGPIETRGLTKAEAAKRIAELLAKTGAK